MSGVNEYAVMHRYGQVPRDDQVLAYLKALKVIIGADGDIADAEWEALVALLREMGASDSVLTAIEEFDNTSAKLEDVLPSMTAGGRRARLLLRDAVEISSADGVYAAEEQAAVKRCAELLKVEDSTLRAIEALVEMEGAVAKLYKSIFLRA